MTRVLADAGGNITDLSTRLVGSLYVVVAEVDLPAGVGRTRSPASWPRWPPSWAWRSTLRPADADLL